MPVTASAGPSLAVRLLGRFQVEVDGEPVDERAWQRRSARHLVKLLALRPGYQLHKEQAMEALWPDSSARAAENNLNKAIYMARQALESSPGAGSQSRFLRREAELIVLRADGTTPWVDVDIFERQATQAIKLGTAEALESALAYYSGTLLADDPYEDWIDDKRRQLSGLHRELLMDLAERLRARESYQAAIDHLCTLLQSDAANERAHRLLMTLYALAGRRRDALEQYRRCCDAVREELAAEPEEATEALHAQIVAGQLAPAPPVNQQLHERADALIESIAVLPFANGSNDAELDYLCEGITESLINQIARFGEIRVMARSTVFRYDASQVDPLQIGRELGVQALLLGRLSQWTETLNVGAEFVRVADGTLLWGDHYNRKQSDIFAVQDEIASSISRAVQGTLHPNEVANPPRRNPANTQAYRCYLRGRFHWNKRTAVALRAALIDFQEAIDLDPDYALAHAGLADCHNLSSLYHVESPLQAMPKARAAALHALNLDDALAEAHTSLAYCRLYYEWDWQAAERGFATALQLDPSYATAHHWYHELLTALGRFDEQAERIAQARALDPLSLIINTEVGWGLYYARRYDEAVADLRETLRLDARFPVAHLIMGCALHGLQKHAEAISHVRTAVELQGGDFPLGLAVLGHIHGMCGDVDAARAQQAALTEAAVANYVAAYCFALIHIGLGEHELALQQLEAACEERCDRLIFLRVDPMFDTLRSHPGFDGLLRRLNLA